MNPPSFTSSPPFPMRIDRKSTRLNSSHIWHAKHAKHAKHANACKSCKLCKSCESMLAFATMAP